jgi:hypothetical protein
MKVILIVGSMIAVGLGLASLPDTGDGPQLPPAPQQALMPIVTTQATSMSHTLRLDHPSGLSVIVMIPTNHVSLCAPDGYELRSRPLRTFTLESLHDFKRTNVTGVVYYLVPVSK